MGINVLGPLTVDGPGRLGPHDRVVLQALATRLGQPVSADELVDAVWGDRPPASATKNLQSSIVKIRKVLGAAAIETSHHGYVLAVPPDQLDAHDFEERVTRARALLTVGESDRVAFLMEQALAQWRGAAFADLPEWAPARREAGRLDDLRLEAQEMHVDAMLRSGRPREVLALAHALVRAAPLRERRWELLVLAQYQTGAQGEALRSLRQLRAVLARELGIDPSPEMLALEQSILQQDPRLLVPQPAGRACTLPMAGACGVRRRRHRAVLRPRRGRGRLLGDPGPGVVRRAGGSVRIGQVLPPARRGAGRPAPPRPPGRPRHSWASPDAVAQRAARGRTVRHGPRRGPGRGGVRSVRRPGGEADLSGAAGRGVATAAGARHGAGRPPRAGDRARGLQPVGGERPAPRRRPRRGRPAAGDRTSRRAGGPGHRARPGRPPRARGARRPRRPAPALARPARDVAASRGEHPDRRRLPRLRRYPRRRRPVRRAALRTDRARAASPASRPGPAAGVARRGGRSSQEPRAATSRRACPRPARRSSGRRSPGDQRRRSPRDHPRGPGPGLAPTAGLARRRRRGATHPSPPQRRGRRLGHAGPTCQRALPRGPADPRAGLAGANRNHPHRDGGRVPGRRPGGLRRRGAERRRARTRTGAADPSAADRARRCRRAPRPRPGGRRHGRGPVRPGRASTPPGRSRRLSPQTRAGSEPGRSSPRTSASRCCSRPRAHAWTTRRRPGSTW